MLTPITGRCLPKELQFFYQNALIEVSLSRTLISRRYFRARELSHICRQCEHVTPICLHDLLMIQKILVILTSSRSILHLQVTSLHFTSSPHRALFFALLEQLTMEERSSHSFQDLTQ